MILLNKARGRFRKIRIGKWFFATCLENNVASQGKTVDEATENLKEAIALYYENETAEEMILPEHKQVCFV